MSLQAMKISPALPTICCFLVAQAVLSEPKSVPPQDEWSRLVATAERQQKMKNLAAAEDAWRQALALAQASHDHSKLRHSLRDLADVLAAENKTSEALAFYRQELAITEEILGTSHQSLDPIITKILALGVSTTPPTEQATLLAKLVELRKAASDRARPELVIAEKALIAVLLRSQQFSQAKDRLLELQGLQKQGLSYAVALKFFCLIHLEFVCRQLGKAAEADMYARQILPIIKKYTEPGAHRLAKSALADQFIATDMANNVEQAAGLYRQYGAHAREAQLLPHAIALRKSAASPLYGNLADDYLYLAYAYIYSGHPESAKAALQSALSYQDKATPPNPTTMASILISLAGRYTADGEQKKADAIYQRLLKMPDLPPDMELAAFENMASAAFKAGEFAKARELLKKALALAAKHKKQMDTAAVLRMLAATYRRTGDCQTAQDYVHRAGLIYDQLKVKDKSLFNLLLEQGKIEVCRHEYNQARLHLGKALALGKTLKLSAVELYGVLRELADATAMPNSKEVIALREEAFALCLRPGATSEWPPVTQADALAALKALTSAYESAGQFDLVSIANQKYQQFAARQKH